jgi:hypothetical protein
MPATTETVAAAGWTWIGATLADDPAQAAGPRNWVTAAEVTAAEVTAAEVTGAEVTGAPR